MSRFRFSAFVACALVFTALSAEAQVRVTTPVQQFGHEIGADYQLPNYTQFVAYFEKLANESDRMVLDTIGRTAEGRPQVMAIVTAPQNFAKLDRLIGIGFEQHRIRVDDVARLFPVDCAK